MGYRSSRFLRDSDILIPPMWQPGDQSGPSVKQDRIVDELANLRAIHTPKCHFRNRLYPLLKWVPNVLGGAKIDFFFGDLFGYFGFGSRLRMFFGVKALPISSGVYLG